MPQKDRQSWTSAVHCLSTSDVDTDSDHSPMDATAMREVSKLVWQVGLSLVLVTGTFGNIMILLIECRLRKRSVSSLSLYFICLAVLDLTVSWFCKLFFFLSSFNIFFESSVLCKIRVFLSYASSHIIAALVVALTFQRAAAILWPLKFSSEKIARAVVCTIFVFFTLLNSHTLYGYSLRDSASENDTEACFVNHISEDYSNFIENAYVWVDACLTSLLPFCLLLAANCVLVWKVAASLKAAKENLTARYSSQICVRHKQSSSLTVTLIAVSISFVVLTLPLSVYGVFIKRLSQGPNATADTAAASNLIIAVTYVLYFCNNSINFYVFCLTGSKYRSEFANMFRWQKIIDNGSTRPLAVYSVTT